VRRNLLHGKNERRGGRKAAATRPGALRGDSSEIRRINSRGYDGAARVKDAFVHNELAATLSLEPAVYSLGRHPVSQVLTKAADGVKELTEQEQDALIDTFASESAALARTRPETVSEAPP
jgi:hypothetical protein